MPLRPPEEWRNVRFERDGAVTKLTLHTDGGPLVWDAGVHRELADVWAWLQFDEETRVVILTGTGDRWCDTIDSPSGTKPWFDIWWEGRRIVAGLVELEVPVITIVNGPATIHAELAVLGDIVLAVPSATFADRAHTVRGIVPGDGVQTVWRELLGPTRAAYFLLTGTEIGSEEALRLGIVHEIHDATTVDDRARALAATLSALPGDVLAYTRATLRGPDRRALSDTVGHGLALAGLGRLAGMPPPS
jgi:enoyl-CoA hydratase/carnithine racemase